MIALANFFQSPPINTLNRVHVMGMLANGIDIGPRGIHLRWMFPLALGIPKTTEIFRKDFNTKNITRFGFDKIQPNEPLKANESYDNKIIFSGFSPSGLLGMPGGKGLNNVNKNPTQRLLIQFPNYISNFKISIIHQADISAFAYKDKIAVERQTAFIDKTGILQQSVLSFENIEIDSIAIDLTFDVLLNFEYADTTALLNEPGWVNIKTSTSLGNLTDYLNKCRINSDIFNYYLTKNTTQRAAAIAHYTLKAIELENLYRFLINTHHFTDAEVFDNPGENLANLRFKTQEGKPFNNIKPISLICMAAQDPNLASILGLYYVDQNIPDVKAGYNYKIQCSYDKDIKACGLILNLGNEMYATVPELGEVLVKDCGSKSWEYDNLIDNPTLVGNIGLKWQKPIIDVNNARHRFNEPVFFAVKRNPEFKPVAVSTNPLDKLVVVPENNFMEPLLNNFTDTKVKRLEGKNYTYEVSTVSVFGQMGKVIVSKDINITEVIPVPPIALSIQEVKLAAQPLKQKLRFKFGAAQYFVAPHTKRFLVFTRAKSLIDKQEFSYTLDKVNGLNYSRTRDGHKLFTLRFIKDAKSLSIFEQLSGDLNSLHNKPWHTAEFNLDNDKKLLPTALIKKFSIQKFNGNESIEIIVDTNEHKVYEIPATGFITLIKDTHSTSVPGNWRATNLSVNLVAPKRLVLIDAKQVAHFNLEAPTTPGFSAVVTKKITIAPIQDRVSGNTISPSFTELFFNRALLEQGIFDGGTVSIGNTSTRLIIYQGGGIASANTTPIAEMNTDAKKARFARILVEGDFPEATVDSSIILKPAFRQNTVTDTNNPLSGFFTLKFSTPAVGIPTGFGDVLLKIKQVLKIGSEGERLKDHIAPVSLPTLSDFAITNSGVEVLVKIDKKINSFTPGTVNHCAFFSQYEVDISAVIAAQSIPANEATVNNFFAIQSETDGTADFKRGVLSAPAQYYKVNITVPATPGNPNPCVMPPAGEKAFLPPPDLKGYAVNCISWPVVPNLRYEVYRALDATILVQHKNELLRGNRISVTGLTIPAAITLTLPLDFSDGAGSGILSANFTTPSINVNGENAFIGASLEISKSGKKNYYQVVAAKILSANFTPGSPQILILGLSFKAVNVKDLIAPAAATNKLILLPDYNAVAKNETVLIAMSNHPSLEKAYSLVSTVPVRGNSFNDFVAARGNNMFFYKIRAVSASEVKSAFSTASMPIYQMDTTPPDEVQEFRACSIDNRAMLVWKKDPRGEIRAYRLIKETIPAGGGNKVKTEKEIQDFELLPKPFFVSNGNTILFSKPLVLGIPATVTNTSGMPTGVTNTSVKNSISVKEITPSGTRVLISPIKYKINYIINLQLKKFVISSIEFLEKRDAGIFFEIGLNNQLLTSEFPYLIYIDSEVATGQMVKYSLVPLKFVGPQPQIKISGLPAGSTTVEIKDFAKPTLKIVKQIINLSGIIAPISLPNCRTKFSITNKTNRVVFIRFKKLISLKIINTTYTKLSDGKSYSNWIPITEPSCEFTDDTLNSSGSFRYTIQLKSEAGVLGDDIILTNTN